jgi:DNA polymerase elongation subunit (family B)
LSSFYTSVLQYGNKIYVRGYDKGVRIKKAVPYQPYLFLPNKDGDFKTLDGSPVSKKHFETIKDAKTFLERFQEVKNFSVYGLNHFTYAYIFDSYQGDIDYDPKLVNVVTLDIEVGGEDIVGFPKVEQADQPITAITMHLRGKTASFGLKDFKPKSENSLYLKCKSEADLIEKFMQVWESEKWNPDILTGWNVEFFDVPYLINRMKRIFGDKYITRLSPWGRIDEKTIEQRGKSNRTYSIPGIAVLYYYQLYRKFTFGNQESYKLDYIANVELGENKIDYSEYGSLNDLYKKNFQLYMEYNIHDVMLVQRLEDKLKFIEQVMALAYDAKVNYVDTLTTVRPWDIIIHNYLLEQGIVIPLMTENVMDKELVGGHVKEPIPGLYDWVVSFDLNSLYPHLIMQYNISPETYIDKFEEFPSIDEILVTENKFGKDGPDGKTDTAIAANGCYFRKDFQGFLPALMEKMYNDRVKYKKLMIEAKQRYEKNPNSEDEKLIARYHNMQMAKKIQLNSAYGALGNQYFRWFNFNLAESITMSGQLSIRWIEQKINLFMNDMLKTKDIDYVIASDTDSIYVSMSDLVKRTGVLDDKYIVNAIDQFCEQKIQPYIDQCYQELADKMSAYQQKMKMKRETIANKGIWRKKKMYILNAWDIEGVRFEKPKLKINGIEAVRSSTPRSCRDSIKKALDIIMNKTQQDLSKFVIDFRTEFETLPFEDIAFPRGMNGIKEYADNFTIFKQKTPIHTKGALLFNHLLKHKGIDSIAPIQDGDKIKFIYLRMPNPINSAVITVPDELPKELGLDNYIDRDKQFEIAFLGPLRSITDLIGWNASPQITLDAFFE